MLPGFRSVSETDPPESLLDSQRRSEVHGLGSLAEFTGSENAEIPSLLDRPAENGVG